MRIIVQKYGGSSLSDSAKVMKVAARVAARREQGFHVVVVVSAMGGTTDRLLSMANEINPNPSKRELDMLVTVGERISMALLSMAIQSLGHSAISFTGSQSGIITNASHNHARIIEIRPFRILDELEKGKIVIIAGYQGMSYNREITSLGRGGSDTTAVAMAAALDAEACEIYSDVDGVYSADPRVVVSARKLDEITYDEMIALSRHGAVVLNSEAVEFARRRGIALYARASFGGSSKGTVIRRGQKTVDRTVKAVVHKPVWVIRWDSPLTVDRELHGFIAGSGAVVDYLVQGGMGFMVLDVSDLIRSEQGFKSELENRLKANIIKGLSMVTVVGEAIFQPEVYNCFMKQVGHVEFSFVTPLTINAIVRSDRAVGLVKALHDSCVEVVDPIEK